MYNAKDSEEIKGKIPFMVEDRKYFKHETVHNNGVGYYSNVHNNIFKKY
ncbi:hypothetical protein [Thermobrachium celere]|nr:hypothetical protein [Thermobrachium celere]GFR35570.1 hypothetical protein TCEA9_13820 [Thermobrachium celere]